MKQINLEELDTIQGGQEVASMFCWMGCGFAIGMTAGTGGAAIAGAVFTCGACLAM